MFIQVHVCDHHFAKLDEVHVRIFVFVSHLELLLRVVEGVHRADLVVLLVEVDGARPVFVDHPEQLAQLDECLALVDFTAVHDDVLVEPLDPLVQRALV